MCYKNLGFVDVCYSDGLIGLSVGCEAVIDCRCGYFFGDFFGYNNCWVVSGSGCWCLVIGFLNFFCRHPVGCFCSETEEEEVKVGANHMGFLLNVVNFSWISKPTTFYHLHILTIF